MGLRFRKSFNFGGFRINLSKSGIGYSFGFPGMRFTQLANGRKRSTLSIPGTGISWVEEGTSRQTAKKDKISLEKVEQITGEIRVDDNFKKTNYQASQNPVDYEPIDESGILKSINQAKTNILFFYITIMSLFLLVCVSAYLEYKILTYVLLILILITVFFRIFLREFFYVQIEYEMDKEVSDYYQKMNFIWENISTCEEISTTKKIVTTDDKKYYAGSEHAACMEKATLKKEIPSYIKTNIEVYVISCVNEEIYFFPDMVLIGSGKNVSAFPFGDLQWLFIAGPYATVKAPSDTKVLGHVWRYANKNGGPDLRFKDNYQLPVCLMGSVFLTSDNGFSLILNFSNGNLVDTLEKKYEEIKIYIKKLKIFDNHRRALLPIKNPPFKLRSNIICKKCGHSNDGLNRYCVKCGNYLNRKKEPLENE